MDEVVQALEYVASKSELPASARSAAPAPVTAPAARRRRSSSFARWTLRLVSLVVFAELAVLVALEIPPAREKLAPHMPPRVVERVDVATAWLKERIRPREWLAGLQARFQSAPAADAGTAELQAGIDEDAGSSEVLVAGGPDESAQADAGTAGPPSTLAADTVQWRFESVPSGAKVILHDDGTTLGTTPLERSMPRADAGLALRIELAGYQSASKTVHLSDGGVVKVTLTPKPPQPEPKPKTDLSREGTVDPFEQ
jgi:hypothetical protein